MSGSHDTSLADSFKNPQLDELKGASTVAQNKAQRREIVILFQE
jgi:hypothetical protein